MTLDEFVERLEAAAIANDWPVESVDEFLLPRFRGRSDDSVVDQSADIAALRLGAYPVLVAMIELEDIPRIGKDLKRLHGQMVVARSYMKPSEVINAHLLLCATRSKSDVDWRVVKDIAERNEAVCRKVVWMLDPKGIETSWADFIDRTFLATPWRQMDTQPGTALDSTVSVARRVLEDEGLPSVTAAKWVAIAQVETDDPENRVNLLVDALEARS